MKFKFFKYIINKNENENKNENIEITISVPSFTVLHINKKFEDIFKWSNEEIYNSKLDIILSDNLYQYCCERKNEYKNKFPGEKLKLAREKITKLLNIRFWPLITKKNEIIWVEVLKIESFIDLKINVNDIYIKVALQKLELNGKTPYISSMYFLEKINNKAEFYIKEYKNSIIIMMDLNNSTGLSKEKKPYELALLYSLIMKKVKEIEYKYFPFFQFVEACGDSLLFLHCPESMLEKKNIATLALQYASELTNKINYEIKEYNTFIRCSIIKGDIVGGVIDGATVRYFGYTINLASRLENMCNKNNIIIDKSLKFQLINENNNFIKFIEEKTAHLKGIGNYTYSELNLELFNKDLSF